MTIEYYEAPDVKELVDNITETLNFFHVVPQFIYCVRSKGSKSRRILARIHGLGRIWQEALRQPPSYIIEVISENYDKLSQAGKEKTIIHELLHVPKGFKGGFRPHKGYIDQKTIETYYKKLQELKKKKHANET